MSTIDLLDRTGLNTYAVFCALRCKQNLEGYITLYQGIQEVCRPTWDFWGNTNTRFVYPRLIAYLQY